jgi:hypothetical protein
MHMRKGLKIAGAIVAAFVLLGIGAAIGSGGKSNASGSAKAGPTVTVSVPVPGPTTVVYTPAPKVVTQPTPKPPKASYSMPGDGTFLVGYAPGDWRPGTWQSGTPGSGNCYWATLSNLTGAGESSGIIDNDNSAGPSVITVTSGDKGVQVSGCAEWHRI